MRIKDIGDFRYGYHTSKKSTGKIKYLTAKNFDDESNFLPKSVESFIDVTDKKILNKFLLKPNDVIIAGKGYRIFSWAYDSSSGDCIPSSLFYKLSLNPKIILSKFFQIQFNIEIKKILHNKYLEGTTIPVINSKDILDTHIKIPSLSKQKEIIDLWGIMSEQNNIYKSLSEKVKLRNELIIKDIL